MHLESWSFGLPVPRNGVPPEGPAPHRDLIFLGALTMYITVFLTLIGRGQAPQDAVSVTIALAMSATALAHRLLDGDDDRGEGPR